MTTPVLAPLLAPLSDLTEMFQDETVKPAIDDLGKKLILERRHLDNLNEQVRNQQFLVTQIEEFMYDLMVSSGITKIGIEGVTLSPQHQYWASIRQESNEGFEWLKRHELQDLIKLTVNSQTLSACVRQLLEAEVITKQQNQNTGDIEYFDGQGKILGISIYAKKKILARGIK